MEEAAPRPAGAATPAEIYERVFVPAIFMPWSDVLLDRARLAPGERVLDVACGTGVVARRARERVGRSGRVVALDADAGAVRLAERLEPAIEWHAGDAQRLPFAERTFDAILCQQGVQFFRDRQAGLREMRRVARDGGRLVLAVWRDVEHAPGYAAFAVALGRYAGAAAGKLRPFSLASADELRALVETAGWAQIALELVSQPVRFPSARIFVEQLLAGTPPLQALLAPVDEAGQRAFVAEVVAALATYDGVDGLVFPMEAHLVTARAG